MPRAFGEEMDVNETAPEALSAAAQATGDEARLVLGISAGWVNGADLWSVSPQAVQFTTPTDSFGLSRRIRSNLSWHGRWSRSQCIRIYDVDGRRRH